MSCMSPSTVPHHEGADRLLGLRRQQWADEGEPGLHGAGGDEHLRDEDDLLAEAIPLEVEAGEQPVVEDDPWIDVRLDGLLHALVRVVVVPLLDRLPQGLPLPARARASQPSGIRSTGSVMSHLPRWRLPGGEPPARAVVRPRGGPSRRRVTESDPLDTCSRRWVTIRSPVRRRPLPVAVSIREEPIRMRRGSSTICEKMTARDASKGRRAHHRCRVLGCPCRIDFSRTLAASIASSGRTTSMSFLLAFTPRPATLAPSPRPRIARR